VEPNESGRRMTSDQKRALVTLVVIAIVIAVVAIGIGYIAVSIGIPFWISAILTVIVTAIDQQRLTRGRRHLEPSPRVSRRAGHLDQLAHRSGPEVPQSTDSSRDVGRSGGSARMARRIRLPGR